MLPKFRNASVWLGLLLIGAYAGCGGPSNEVEIVAPEQPIPVANPDPKAPMANINENNESQHPEALKGSIVTPGKPF